MRISHRRSRNVGVQQGERQTEHRQVDFLSTCLPDMSIGSGCRAVAFGDGFGRRRVRDLEHDGVDAVAVSCKNSLTDAATDAVDPAIGLISSIPCFQSSHMFNPRSGSSAVRKGETEPGEHSAACVVDVRGIGRI